MIEDWELSRLELGLKFPWSSGKEVFRFIKIDVGGNKFQEALKLSAEAQSKMKLNGFYSEKYEAEEYIFSGDCKEMQGDTEDEQVCSITGGKLKRSLWL